MVERRLRPAVRSGSAVKTAETIPAPASVPQAAAEPDTALVAEVVPLPVPGVSAALMRKVRASRRRAERHPAPLEASAQEQALRRLKHQVQKYLRAYPDGPKTPLERVVLASLKHELLVLLRKIKDERESVARQMGQTSVRTKAVSAYAKTFRKT